MMTLLIHRTQEIVMKKLFKEALEDSPIIAAVKDDEGLSMPDQRQPHYLYLIR